MALFSSLFGGNKPAAMPAVQPMSPEAQYLQNMQRLSQGDVSSVLTGGDKLLALSALLGSVARGSRTTPQEVMAQVQQQAQGRISSQMELAKLQANAEREKRQRAFVEQYSSNVPEAKREILKNADPSEAFKLVQEEVFRPKQVFQTKRDPDTGRMRVLFQDGTDQLTDIKLPANTEDRDIGGAIQVIDKDTGQVLQTIPKTMAPGEAARLSLAERQFRFQQSRPSGGGGDGGDRVQLVQTADGFATFNPRAGTISPITTPLRPKAGADPLGLGGILSGAGKPLYGGR